MTPTRIRTLLLTAFVCGVAAWLVLRLVYAELPSLPWTAVPALLLLAFAEAWSGLNLRSRLRGKRVGAKPVAPIAVARMAVLAKASSLAGAVVGGLASGLMIFLAGNLEKTAYQADLPPAGATLGAAVLLILAALYLEYSCRVPTSGKKDDERSGHSGPAPRR